MQSRPEFENDHPQIQYVKVAVPYKRVFLFLAIAVALQMAIAAVGVYLFSNQRFFDVCTVVALLFFLAGSLMWGKFPSADQPMAGHMVDRNHLDAEMQGRKTSFLNQVRGSLIMLSGVLFVSCIAVVHWLLQN
jgi:hypothetical protein